MIYRDHGAEWIEEDRPTDDFPMARSNHAAEASARRLRMPAGQASCSALAGSMGRAPSTARNSSRWRVDAASAS